MRALPIAAAICLAAAAYAAPRQRIIFDTDMVEDFDDVGAVATLHALADAGGCEIAAMGTCTRGNSSVAAVEVLNAFYGRPDIPVGCTKEIGIVGSPSGDMKHHQKYVRLAKDYAHWVRHANSDDAPDANEVYRRALAAAPDGGVTFVSVGFTTNMRRLLETKPDSISPLDGVALVARKVSRWFAMGCKYPSGKEYNSSLDAESSRIAFERWPTPIVFSDFNLGVDIHSGRTAAEREYGYRNPVKDIFASCLPPREKCRGLAVRGRSSWDEVTVFAAVKGIGDFFNVEKGFYRIVGADGTNEWVPDESSRHCRLVESKGNPRRNYSKEEIGLIVDDLIAREPNCRRSVGQIVTLRTEKASAEVALDGARVMSLKLNGDDVLWRPREWQLVGEGWYDGGIPLCWPWFGRSGSDTNVVHGFARCFRFSVRGKKEDGAKSELVLGLSSDDMTKRRWPHDFDLEYRISLTDRLRLELKTTNTGKEPFAITTGFHPYFVIGDRDRTTVTGTDGMKFCDSRVTREYGNVWRGDMRLTSSFDHVFVEPADTAFHAIDDPVRGRRIGIASSGAARLVVWNPGVEEEVSDNPGPGGLATGDWRKLVCVEPAILWGEAERTVAPGASHTLSAEISVER